MNKKIFSLLSLAILIIIFLAANLSSTETLKFQLSSDGMENWAEFQRNEKKYRIKKIDSGGSGQYVIYTLHLLDASGSLVDLQEFTTCGKFKLNQNNIEFFGPKEFHCGNFAILADLFNPEISTFDF